jgi:hypothetical protein
MDAKKSSLREKDPFGKTALVKEKVGMDPTFSREC